MSSSFKYYNLKNSSLHSWYVIHLLAANGRRTELMGVLEVFGERFVCPKCREHIKRAITSPNSSFPPESCSVRELFEWSVWLHNQVSKYLGKPQLSKIGAEALFHELTDGADEDGRIYKESGECDGCKNDIETSNNSSIPVSYVN